MIVQSYIFGQPLKEAVQHSYKVKTNSIDFCTFQCVSTSHTHTENSRNRISLAIFFYCFFNFLAVSVNHAGLGISCAYSTTEQGYIGTYTDRADVVG